MIQVATLYAINQGTANEMLRAFQREYPKRKIIGISMVPNTPTGWFMTVSYEVDM